MRTFGLILLLSVRVCASARYKLSLGKHASLDLNMAGKEFASGPDKDFSQMLAEAGNTCGGNFLEQFSKPAEGTDLVHFDWKTVIKPMDKFLADKEEQIKDLSAEVENLARKLKDQAKKVQLKPKLPRDQSIEKMIAHICDDQFNEWEVAEGTDGINSCKAAMCGLACFDPQCPDDDYDSMYETQTFADRFVDRYGEHILSKYDIAPEFAEACKEVFYEEIDQEEQDGYTWESSWCPSLCQKLTLAVNKLADDAGVGTQEELQKEMNELQELFNSKTFALTTARADKTQCKKLKENIGEFVSVMGELYEGYDDRVKDRQRIQWKGGRAQRKLAGFKKKMDAAAVVEEEAKKKLDEADAIEKKLIADVDKQRALEAEVQAKLDKKNEITKFAEEDVLALMDAKQLFAIFKSKLSFALLKMYLYYELTIIQPLEKLVIDVEELQNVFVDPSEILSGAVETEKGGQTTMIDDIERLLFELQTNCQELWLPSFKKIELVNYRLVLPSIGDGQYNMTKISDATKELLNKMPEDVKDIVFPDGFLSTPDPEGLPDLCQSPEIDAIEVTKEQVLEVVEERRQQIIEAFIKILAVSTDAIEAKASTANIIGVDGDVHDCQHEPEGLRKFALIFGSIDFYKNYVSLWGHLKTGGLSYFLLLEAQLEYLFIVAEEREKQHKEDQVVLLEEVERMLEAGKQLDAELEAAMEQTKGNREQHEKVKAVLDAERAKHDEQQKLVKQLAASLDEANKMVDEALQKVVTKHKEGTESRSSSLIHMAIKGMRKAQQQLLAEQKKNSRGSAGNHADMKMWRRKTLQLRADIEKIKNEAVFLPPF